MTGVSLAGWQRRWWLWLAAGSLIAGVVFGLLLPVYSDEVVWRFSERAAIDGFDKLAADTCGPNTLAVPPWFIWPARWFSAAFNLAFAGPLWVRLSGVCYALLLIWLLWRLAGRLAAEAEQRATLRALGLGLLALGVMPLLLVWSRPEQPILLAFTAALLVAEPGWHRTDQPSPGEVARRVAAILGFAIIALSYHMKATLLAPAFALAMLTAAPGTRGLGWRLGGAAVLTGLALVAADYWVARFSCPADRLMARNITSQNVTALFLRFRDWPLLWAMLWKNADLFRYFSRVAPHPVPMSFWLPSNLVTRSITLVWKLCIFAAWVPMVAGGMIAVGAEAWRCLRRPRVFSSTVETLRDSGTSVTAGENAANQGIESVFRSNLVGKRSRVDPRVLMAALLYSLVSVWGVTQTAKNVYDATFMLPLWLLASWLALSGANLPSLAWACIRCFTVGIASLAMISVIALAVSHGPSLVRRAMAQDELPGQPYSIPNFRFADTAAEIETTARMCHIPTDTTGHALMIDENTYFIAMRSHRPQFHLGVVGVWHGGITDPIAYLRGLGSDGALVACRNLPPALRQHAHRSGNFCCLGPPGW